MKPPCKKECPTTPRRRPSSDHDPRPEGVPVGKLRPLKTLTLSVAGLVVFAFTFSTGLAFAQEGTTVVQSPGGSSDLSSEASTNLAPSSEGAQTVPSVPATEPSGGTTTTTSDPAATVPSATTIPTGQSQYSDAQSQYPGAAPSQYSGDPPQQSTLANTGGISPIAIVVGVMVVLAAFGVWLGLRRDPEAPNE